MMGLSIKMIKLREHDTSRVKGGGGKDYKIYLPEDAIPGWRESLLEMADSVNQSLSRHFEGPNSEIPGVASVSVLREARAKSHRPLSLFDRNTCPVIGGDGLGEMLVSVTRDGLNELKRRIAEINTPAGLENITAVSKIEPFRPPVPELDDSSHGQVLVRVLNYGDPLTNLKVRDLAKSTLDDMQVSSEWLKIGSSYDVLRVHGASSEVVSRIAEVPGIRRVTLERDAKRLLRRPRPQLDLAIRIPAPVDGFDYPIVGLVDSGIPAQHPLSAWIHNTEVFVAPEERNHDHGAFVGGILAFGDSLKSVALEPTEAVKLLDVCILPDEDFVLTPTEALTAIQSAVSKHRDRVRIWNLSFNWEELGDDGQFTELAMGLDSIQDEYGVEFVISCGNYDTEPLRTWPPQVGFAGEDGLASPAESVRAIAVGSISRDSNPSTLSPTNAPSPFSRRGPGPAFLMKPDLVDYGGNCDSSGVYGGLGEVSFDATGRLVEDIGTSAAAPKISHLMARVAHAYNGRISRNMLRALVTHAANHPGTGAVPSAHEVHYYGLGKPDGMARILSCTEGSATFALEGSVYPGYQIEIPDFPYPPDLLKDGKWFGEILATLVYDPPLDERGGSTYIRTNLTLSLGTYTTYLNEKGEVRINHTRQVHPVPYLGGGLYESDLLEHGWKWAPVKTYYRKITNGIKSNPWRLVIELLRRDELVTPVHQAFALVITFKGPDGSQVYSTMVNELTRVFALEDLPLRTAIRTRIGIV